MNKGEEIYLPYDQVVIEAARLDLEVVPLLFIGKVESAEQLKAFLETQSFLGGQKIEGVVVKPVDYNHFGYKKSPYGQVRVRSLQRNPWRRMA